MPLTTHNTPQWNECCSCCPVLERENRELKAKIKELRALTDDELIIYRQVIDTLKECNKELPDNFTDKLKQRIKELNNGTTRHNN